MRNKLELEQEVWLLLTLSGIYSLEVKQLSPAGTDAVNTDVGKLGGDGLFMKLCSLSAAQWKVAVSEI